MAGSTVRPGTQSVAIIVRKVLSSLYLLDQHMQRIPVLDDIETVRYRTLSIAPPGRERRGVDRFPRLARPAGFQPARRSTLGCTPTPLGRSRPRDERLSTSVRRRGGWNGVVLDATNADCAKAPKGPRAVATGEAQRQPVGMIASVGPAPDGQRDRSRASLHCGSAEAIALGSSIPDRVRFAGGAR